MLRRCYLPEPAYVCRWHNCDNSCPLRERRPPRSGARCERGRPSAAVQARLATTQSCVQHSRSCRRRLRCWSCKTPAYAMTRCEPKRYGGAHLCSPHQRRQHAHLSIITTEGCSDAGNKASCAAHGSHAYRDSFSTSSGSQSASLCSNALSRLSSHK